MQGRKHRFSGFNAPGGSVPHVAVAHGRHRDHRPPERVRYRFEEAVLRAGFREVDRWREQHHTCNAHKRKTRVKTVYVIVHALCMSVPRTQDPITRIVRSKRPPDHTWNRPWYPRINQDHYDPSDRLIALGPSTCGTCRDTCTARLLASPVLDELAISHLELRLRLLKLESADLDDSVDETFLVFPRRENFRASLREPIVVLSRWHANSMDKDFSTHDDADYMRFYLWGRWGWASTTEFCLQ